MACGGAQWQTKGSNKGSNSGQITRTHGGDLAVDSVFIAAIPNITTISYFDGGCSSWIVRSYINATKCLNGGCNSCTA
jgi:hypothetical protein